MRTCVLPFLRCVIGGDRSFVSSTTCYVTAKWKLFSMSYGVTNRLTFL